jgi:hypothetical protein
MMMTWIQTVGTFVMLQEKLVVELMDVDLDVVVDSLNDLERGPVVVGVEGVVNAGVTPKAQKKSLVEWMKSSKRSKRLVKRMQTNKISLFLSLFSFLFGCGNSHPYWTTCTGWGWWGAAMDDDDDDDDDHFIDGWNHE